MSIRNWGRVVRLGPGNSEATVALETSEVSIGRRPKCHVVCEHDAVSAEHCKLLRTENPVKVELEDCSTNGTYVNGQRIGKGKKAILKAGDMIQLTKPKRPGPPVLLRLELASETQELTRRESEPKEQSRVPFAEGEPQQGRVPFAEGEPQQCRVPFAEGEPQQGKVRSPAGIAVDDSPVASAAAAPPTHRGVSCDLSAAAAPPTHRSVSCDLSDALQTSPKRDSCPGVSSANIAGRLASVESHASAVLDDVSKRRTAVGEQMRDDAKRMREANAQIHQVQAEFEAQITEHRRQNERLEQACRSAEGAVEHERAETERLQQALAAEQNKSNSLECDIKKLKDDSSTFSARAQDAEEHLKTVEKQNRELRETLQAECAKAEQAAAEAKTLRQRLEARTQALLKLGTATREATREMRNHIETLEGTLSEVCLTAGAKSTSDGPVECYESSQELAQAHRGGSASANASIQSTAPWNPMKEEAEDALRRSSFQSLRGAPQAEAKRRRLWSQSAGELPRGIGIEEDQTIID